MAEWTDGLYLLITASFHLPLPRLLPVKDVNFLTIKKKPVLRRLNVIPGPTRWVTSSPHWGKTGPTRALRSSTTKSASKRSFINLKRHRSLENPLQANSLVINLLAYSLSPSEMATSSCTVQLELSAWLTWPEVTSTGSTRGAPCSPWAPSCSARAASFQLCTGISFSQAHLFFSSQLAN